jgi:hypothetical protein
MRGEIEELAVQVHSAITERDAKIFRLEYKCEKLEKELKELKEAK